MKTIWPITLYRKALAGFFLSTVLFLMACGGSKSTSSVQDFNQLKELVDSRSFEIVHQWVMPSWGGSVSLIGNPNFIRFKGDSVNISLPYYGERYSGVPYGRAGGINYEGRIKNLEINVDREEQKIVMEFEGEQRNENLNFYITLFPNGNVSTSLSSSQRASISYRGKVKTVPEKKD